MNKWIELLIGIVLIVVPIVVVTSVSTFLNWGQAAIEFIKGGIVVCLVIVGIILLILGISDLKG
ncbi:MAG: hypothetical protein QW625_03305 [Candidatus Nanoarchaeia archaeon]